MKHLFLSKMKYAFILISMIFLLSCKQGDNKIGNSQMDKPSILLDAIENVFMLDDSLGSIRNLQPMDDGLSKSIKDYTSALREVNFQSCPSAFKKAFDDHIIAWDNMVAVTDNHDDMRGELHDLFDKIQLTKDSVVFKDRLGAIWNSWYPVEDFKMEGSHRYALYGPDRSIDTFLNYLEGSWKHESKDVFENWKRNQNNYLSGEGISLNAGNKVLREKLELAVIDQNLTYVAKVPDQNEGKAINFVLNKDLFQSWSFENMNHDFPNKIIYMPLGQNRLLVEVRDKKDEGFDINFIRN